MTRRHSVLFGASLLVVGFAWAMSASAEPQSHIERPPALDGGAWINTETKLIPVGGPGHVAPQSCTTTRDCSCGESRCARRTLWSSEE
jgi:hypothetical protein